MQENQNNQPSSWINWQVPAPLAGDYIFKLLLFLFLLPWFLGFKFTPLGWVMNGLLIDFFVYLGYKHRGLL